MLRFLIGCAAALVLAAPAAAADNFPSRPIVMLVAVAPGGTLDTLARQIASGLTTQLGQSVVVENTTGAGGLIGYQRLMKSDPDGYTLMFSNMSLAIIPLLYPSAQVDPVRDLSPIGTVATVPMVLSVSNKSGITSLPEMLKRMRSGGPKLNFGSGGPGTTAHLAEGLFLHISKTQGELIQYRGSGPAIADLMAGTIDAVIDQTVTMMPLHKDKRIRAIAVSAPQRLAQMPDVPTFAEGGLPAFNLAIWNGVVAPRNTPKPVVDKLAAALSKTIDSPEFKNRIDQLAATRPSQAERGPAPFSALLAKDTREVASLAKQIGLTPQQ
ncbi:Bug family tripartite tricarboxylate transporter substrate binding protein [Bordetella genomosp. 11]|uniref:ABC transporter substrate-binding protein n=1 Tax=Bordetella genomosp. 11 TaxID=1416808 RepID=A0A261UN60_9BORD|nr:tripartite tricarboxylate transporter substrate binding protein [Bordetella genomosp. 11]OZI63061.1 ABC transporter substrate-binding protein [Bordetella genomosp. 11]